MGENLALEAVTHRQMHLQYEVEACERARMQTPRSATPPAGVCWDAFCIPPCAYLPCYTGRNW